jgi:hypothetical protein
VGEAWAALLKPIADQRARTGLSRLARWASMRQISPEAVDDAVLKRFIGELEASTLIRNIDQQHRMVAKSWNRLIRLCPDLGLRTVTMPQSKVTLTRLSWDVLPASFRTDVDEYLAWCAMPDPLDDGARARALAQKTLQLRRDQIHSAVTAAMAAGLEVRRLQSLKNLVEEETFKSLLKHRWAEDGRKLSAYTHGVAGTLIALAAEWVKAPIESVARLKVLRRKLGTLPSGLTEKNQALLRKFDDPRGRTAGRFAREAMAQSPTQTALAPRLSTSRRRLQSTCCCTCRCGWRI